MPIPTQDPTGDDDVTPLTGAALYDSIMVDIEPELLTKNIADLSAVIAKETPEQRNARAVRYASAFIEYEKRFAARKADWEAGFKKLKSTAMHVMEGVVVEEEQGNLSSLEASMSSLSA
ncbi:MAG: hypothetical protein PHZ00_02260 [Candidatus Peribacteraceae bacterium]|nr:hypothetical protein [Candidatus Peribacteraceae bacterium]